MKKKKHIDKLFQERFRNFDVSPPPEAWANIKAQLEEKKEDRKVIPLWWKLGGVAALLALLLTIGNSVFNSTDKAPQLTEENTTVLDESDDKAPLPVIRENQSVAPEYATEKETPGEGLDNNKEQISNDKSEDDILNKNLTVKSAVANQNSSDSNIKSDNKDPLLKKPMASGVTSEKEAVAQTRPDKAPAQETILNKNVSEKTVKDDVAARIDKKINDSRIVSDPLIKSNGEVSNKYVNEAVAGEPEKNHKNAEAPEDDIEASKKSIFEAIAENETEEVIAKKEAPDNRWEVSPNVGPVYYSSFGNGSSLDPSFADNSQRGDVNFSYGAAVSYAVSEKLSVRTGINNVNLSYTTGGLELGSGPVSSALKSVDYGGRQNVITAVDKGTFQQNNGSPDGSPFGDLIPKAGGSDASINQSIRYYEIPMELKYALLNKKLGVNMIGGFSTLILGNDEVSVQAEGVNTVLGSANNLNSLSFTTNIGLGFNYKISKRLKFNIEPMFKYQLNPYSDTSVDFNPFYMGVYTGLSFKF